MSEKLTTEEYWTRRLENIKLPQVIDTKKVYCFKVIDRYLKKYLPVHKKFKVLEIGCCPGSWLVYFHKQFGYKPFGVEYSETGATLTRENLQLNNIKGKIYNEDFFDFNPKEKYDVVCSFGFIEHFTDPSQVVKLHVNLLKKNGFLVVMIPNLNNTFYEKLQSIIGKEILEKHFPMSREDLEKFCSKHHVKGLFCNFTGVFNLGLLTTKDFPIMLTYFIIGIRKVIHWIMFQVFKFNKETKLFSPYILYIGKKK